MRFSLTVLILALFAVVAYFYFYLLPEQEAVVWEKPAEDMKLVSLNEEEKITLIEIVDIENDQELTLALEGTEWNIIKPVHYHADPMIMNGLVKALELSSKIRRLKPEGPWSEYGLDQPRMKIGLETDKTPERRYLLFGDMSPVGNLQFARWENENDYFLINPDLIRAFQKSQYSMREKRVIRTPLRAISKIRIQTFSDRFELVQKEDHWVWMEPVALLGEDVHPKDLNEILTQLNDLYIKDFLDKKDSSSIDLGFSITSPSIELWQLGTGNSEAFQLGYEIGTRDSFYGRIKGEEIPFLVARGKILKLFETVSGVASTTGSAV